MGGSIYTIDTESLCRYYFYLLFSFTMMMPETVKLFIFLFVNILFVISRWNLFSYPRIRTQYLNKFHDFLMPCCLLWCHANGIKFKDCCYRHYVIHVRVCMTYMYCERHKAVYFLHLRLICFTPYITFIAHGYYYSIYVYLGKIGKISFSFYTVSIYRRQLVKIRI